MKNNLFSQFKTCVKLIIILISFGTGNINAQIPKIAYSSLLGGSNYDDGQDLMVDDSGFAYIRGYTSSTNFPITPGCFHSSVKTSYFSKISRDGSQLLYSTYLAQGTEVFVQKSGTIYFMASVQSPDFPATSNPDNCKTFFYKINKDGSTQTFLNHWEYMGSNQGSFLIDNNGYAIVIGEAYNTDFPTTTNSFDTSFNGAKDIFIAKLDIENDSVIFSTLIGGSGEEDASITLDNQNNIIIVGTTNSEDFPIVGNSIETFKSGKTSTFVSKLKNDGSELLFSTLIGEGFRPWEPVVDSQNNIYMSGTISSKNIPVTPTAYDTSFNGINDAFLMKLQYDGSQLIYSTFIGGTGTESGRRITVDNSGKVYMTGCTMSADFPVTENAIYPIYGGCAGCPVYGWGDAYFLILNPEGTHLEYSTYLGGPSDEESYSIGKDKSGNIYLTGVSSSSNFPTTLGAYRRTPAGYGDTYITKFMFDMQQFSLSLSTNELSVAGAANSKVSFGISSNTSWKIASAESWLSFDRKMGVNNDSVVVTARTNSVSGPRTGIITVSGNGTDEQTISITQEAKVTGITDIDEDIFEIFPNPTSGQFTISPGSISVKETMVEIYNLQGVQVFSKTFQNTPSATIDISGHSAGIYLVKVIADGVSYEEKILKE
jgi:hypothetical protein